MREFTKDDWMSYGSAEPFKDGSSPQIAYMKHNGFEIVVDGYGVTMLGVFVTKDLAYTLHEGKHKELNLQYAREWIAELRCMTTKEVITFMHALGIDNMI